MFCGLLAAVTVVAAVAGGLASASSAPVTVQIDASAPTTAFPHSWSKCAGSGHALLGLRADWRAHLLKAHSEIGFQYVRFHGILDRDTSLLLDDCKTYSFFNVDSIYDYLVNIGMRPVVELSFVPDCLASGPADIFHYKGDGYPPSDLGQWARFIQDVVSHWVDRYGLAEVSQWYFEIFNEPNCGFWHGSQYDYYVFANYTAHAVKAVSPKLTVVGPATCQLGWIADFWTWCQQHGVPIDGVSSHLYPTDPTLPVGDRFGFSKAITAAAQSVPAGTPFLLTEYNAGLGIGVLDSSYAAAFTIHNVLRLSGVSNLVLWSPWTFTDIFEEGGQYSTPFDPNSFGLQTIHGIPKPAYRAFQLLNNASSERLVLLQTPDASESQISAFSLYDAGHRNILVFLTNFDVKENAAHMSNITVQVVVSGLSTVPSSATWFLMDNTHCNPHQAWVNLGSPMYPTPDQIASMMSQSVPVPEPAIVRSKASGQLETSLVLQPWAVAVLSIPLHG